jgi:hypothetical protein
VKHRQFTLADPAVLYPLVLMANRASSRGMIAFGWFLRHTRFSRVFIDITPGLIWHHLQPTLLARAVSGLLLSIVLALSQPFGMHRFSIF